MLLCDIEQLLVDSLIEQGINPERAEALAQQQAKRIHWRYRHNLVYFADRERNHALWANIRQDYQKLKVKNTQAIAKKYGVSVRTVYRCLKKS